MLEIKNLSIEFQTDSSVVKAVKNSSFEIPPQSTISLVGESGSGKSVTALSIMQLLPANIAKITSGEILFKGENLANKTSKELRKIRGKEISMIFQEPMTSLNPVFTIGNQISESLILHEGLTKEQAWNRSIELLDEVGIPNPEKRISSYPHEMSGGQRQRVMIAMAIACKPSLLIADEPTTALDVTIQKQILKLINDLQKEYKMSVLFITHDLALAADISDSILVMRNGEIVEQKPTKELFENPEHPYSKSLLACRPSLNTSEPRLPTISDFLNEDHGVKEPPRNFKVTSRPRSLSGLPPLLEIKNLKKDFAIEKNLWGKTTKYLHAVDDVSLTVPEGSTIGLVGESGCGKTTLGRSLLRLIEPTSGSIFYKGKDITKISTQEMRSLRKNLQIIFQDPFASLNPRMTILSIITEPMIIHRLHGNSKSNHYKEACALMERVGLDESMLSRYPHEFSGGQRQRICIARALAVKPEFILCDESVSALDVSVQAQILNLLCDLQDEFNLAYLFISHDLSVVKFISDEVAVMSNGKIVEQASSTQIYESPQHEYTKSLLDSIPKGIPMSLRK